MSGKLTLFQFLLSLVKPLRGDVVIHHKEQVHVLKVHLYFGVLVEERVPRNHQMHLPDRSVEQLERPVKIIDTLWLEPKLGQGEIAAPKSRLEVACVHVKRLKEEMSAVTHPR